MLALVDADILAYRCAAACEKATLPVALWQIDQTATRIVEDVNADDWKFYLSGDNNFRYNLYPAYKANRRNMVKPKWLEQCREYLVTEWNASIQDGVEADDALGIAQCTSEFESVICSIDKDLRQVPGNHYHFVNRTWLNVSEFEGWRNFYYQLLVGDPTDNIKGCPGIGAVKAERLLRELQSVEQLYTAVASGFRSVYEQHWFEHLNLNAQLLYVQREEGDAWSAPIPLEQVETLLSSKPTQGTTSEPTKAQKVGTLLGGT